MIKMESNNINSTNRLDKIILDFELSQEKITTKPTKYPIVAALGVNKLEIPIKNISKYNKNFIYAQHYDTHSDNDGWGDHWDVYSDGK